MELQQRLSEELKNAMKNKDGERTSALRMLRAGILNKEKEGSGEVSEEMFCGVVRALIKQRNDSAAMFRQAGRPDAAEKEEREKAILQEFLPVAMDEENLRTIVEQAVVNLGATSPKDMGKVMQAVKEMAAGRAEMGMVSAMVKARLSGGS